MPCIYLLYVCTYVYHEFARIWYVDMYFHVFLVILGLAMTTSLCLYTISRFSKADWLYSHLLPTGGFCTVIRLCYCTVYLLGLRIDICMHICIERPRFLVTVWFYDFGEKWLVHDNPNFVSLFTYMFSEINELVMMLVLYTFCFSFRM